LMLWNRQRVVERSEGFVFSEGVTILTNNVTVENDKVSFVYAQYWHKENHIEKQIILKKNILINRFP
jgi:hypothetical protein